MNQQKHSTYLSKALHSCLAPVALLMSAWSTSVYASESRVPPALAPFVAIDAAHGELTLTHVTVIDGTGGAARHDQTLKLSSGRIIEVRATLPSDRANGESVLDMSGRTVIPGLVGMHNHMFYVARVFATADRDEPIPDLFPQMSYSAPLLYLAGGVTTMRTTGAMDPYADLGVRDAIEANRWVGPHMDVTGPYLQGPGNPFMYMHTDMTPAETKSTVDFWASKGVTSFKAYTNLTRAQLAAAIDAAHSHGLKITGHLCSITYSEAAELGIDNLEHGFFVNTQLDPGKTPDVCPRTGGGPTIRAMVPYGSEAKSLIDLLVKRHVAITSTLPTEEDDGAESPPLKQKELNVLAPQAREALLYSRNRVRQNVADRDGTSRYYTNVFKRGQALELEFFKSGGLLMAGPDPTDDGHIIPGFGDQREIELLVDAGFKAEEAIQVATLNGATYLGRASEIGSIAVGKRADIVVLKGDLTAQISDIENVEFVFRDGYGFDPLKLLEAARGKYGLY